MENASIQVGHENRLFDLIHHVVGCKHHKSHITRQWYLHTLRANAREDYANGYALYAFDLTADLGEDDHFSLLRQGSVRLALIFAVALPATATVVAMPNLKT